MSHPSPRYEELLTWAGAALSAQGLDAEPVSQMLLKLSQPVEMEDVRKVGGGGTKLKGEEGEEGEGTGPERGVRPPTERLRPGSEVEPEARRSRRLSRSPHTPNST